MSSHRLHLEFAPQARHVSTPGLLALLVALLLFAVAALQVGRAMIDHNTQQQALAEVQQAQESQTPKPKKAARANPIETAQAQLVRQTAQRLNTPWADLLAALESAPSNVALLVVEPSAAKRSVALTAEAAGPGPMLKYVQALQGDARFAEVVLVSHQVQDQTPGKPMRFQLRALWGEAP